MPKKKSRRNKNQKILHLYSILMFSRQEHSLKSLAEGLRCSKQTVLRYLDDIEMSAKGTLIRGKYDNGESHYQMVNIPIRPNVSLSPEQIQHLLMCHDLLTHLLPDGMTEEISSIIGHTTVLLDDFDKRDKALRSMFSAKPAEGKIDYDRHEDIISTLKQGIAKSRICGISYESSLDGRPIPLSIAPIRLITYKDGFYVEVQTMEWKDEGQLNLSIIGMTGAFVPIPKEIRILAIHRMIDIELTDTPFEPVRERKKEKDVFGIELEKPFKVKIAFTAQVASYIRKRTWSRDQKIVDSKDGGVILTMVAGNKNEVFSWILSFGLQARIIEPEDLRLAMLNHVVELRNCYASDCGL